MKSVGFWKTYSSDDRPDPHTLVDAEWDPEERRKVIEYLKSGQFKTAWMGYSWCRFCRCNNGDSDLTDGVWVWPEGFAHYLEEHGVKPPEDFLEHVRTNEYKISTHISVPSPELTALAERAVAACANRKDEDIDAWALRLAKDVEKADD